MCLEPPRLELLKEFQVLGGAERRHLEIVFRQWQQRLGSFSQWSCWDRGPGGGWHWVHRSRREGFCDREGRLGHQNALSNIPARQRQPDRDQRGKAYVYASGLAFRNRRPLKRGDVGKLSSTGHRAKRLLPAKLDTLFIG